jgi:hypothetical protein
MAEILLMLVLVLNVGNAKHSAPAFGGGGKVVIQSSIPHA